MAPKLSNQLVGRDRQRAQVSDKDDKFATVVACRVIHARNDFPRLIVRAMGYEPVVDDIEYSGIRNRSAGRPLLGETGRQADGSRAILGNTRR
jgi:hypothetical protein